MFKIWGLLVSLCLTYSVHADDQKIDDKADEFEREYLSCVELSTDTDRLLCYDMIRKLYNTEKLDVATKDYDSDAERYGVLTSNNPNYFSYTFPRDEKFGEEHHAEIYLSIKYPLMDQWLQGIKKGSKDGTASESKLNSFVPDLVYVIYNGLYDFYMLDSDLYDSSPVISRRQNPGFATEYDFSMGLSKLRIGWFHESNGQQLEQGVDELKRFNARELHGNLDYALSEVSRGWDYAQIRWEYSARDVSHDYNIDWYRIQAEYRFFCSCQGFGGASREDEIWWNIGDESKIYDYDGIRVMGETRFNPFKKEKTLTSINIAEFLVRLELKSGTRRSFLDNVGGKVSLGVRLPGLPLVNNTQFTLFYFNGYGREPSTYHLRTDYIGLGLELR